jgi:hypothetical protein
MVRDLQRLVELATKILPNVPPENFSLERWLKAYTKENEVNKYYIPTASQNISELAINNCGTVACAVGWAALYKPFNDLGFKLSTEEVNYDCMHRSYTKCNVFFEGYSSWDAVNNFFNISMQESAYLFVDETYLEEGLAGSLEDVITRINDFLIKGSIKKKLDFCF